MFCEIWKVKALAVWWLRYKNRRNLDSSSRPDRPSARSGFDPTGRGLRKGNLRPTHPACRTSRTMTVSDLPPNLLRGGRSPTTTSCILTALVPTWRPCWANLTTCTREKAHFWPRSCPVVPGRIFFKLKTGFILQEEGFSSFSGP